MSKKNINHRLYPPIYHGRYAILSRFRKRLQSFIGYEYNTLPDELVLSDFGCGDMPYRPLFENVVSRYVGVDLRDNSSADLHFDESGKSALPSNSIDIVLSTQVLEHVRNPHSYLQECLRVLKPDGRLILSTHGYWPYHPDPHDYWRWTCEGLKKVMQDAGFRVTRFEGIIGLGAVGIQLLQDPLLKHIPRPLKHFKYLLTFFFQMAVLLFDSIATATEKRENAWVFMIVAKKST